MAVSVTQLKQLQTQVKKLRSENSKLKKQLGTLRVSGQSKLRNRGNPRKMRRVVKLGGLWADVPTITDQDITLARREAWRTLGTRDV